MDKKSRRENDKISELPDELLLKILSFLPTIDVVATSVLSKRWRFLWKEVNTYMFDGKSISSSSKLDRFVKFTCKRSNVENLHLKLNRRYFGNNIRNLFNKEVTQSLRNLRIEFFYEPFRFSEYLNFYSKLETLILEKLQLVDIPSNVRLTCLKSLHLLSVRFLDDQSVKTLFSKFPCLEDLVIRRSSFTNVIVFTIDIPTLRSLSIDYAFVRSPPTDFHHGFVINAPALRRFSIKDKFSNYLRFENMPELVKASVNVVYDQPNKFLGSLAKTQSLSLCSLISETLYPPSGISFLSLEHLELCSCSAKWWNLLILILKDAPKLRVLKLKLFQKHCVQSKTAMEPWNQPIVVPGCLSYLKIFEWKQFNNTELEKEVAKYILANASCLNKATFYSNYTKKHEIRKELESVARGSKTCQLVFE